MPLAELSARVEAFQVSGTDNSLDGVATGDDLGKMLPALELLALEVEEVRALEMGLQGVDEAELKEDSHLYQIQMQLFAPFDSQEKDDKNWNEERCNHAIECLLPFCFPHFETSQVVRAVLYEKPAESMSPTKELHEARSWKASQIPLVLRLCTQSFASSMSRRDWKSLLKTVRSAYLEVSDNPNTDIELEWWRAIVALYKYEQNILQLEKGSELMAEWFFSFRTHLRGREDKMTLLPLPVQEFEKAPAGLMRWIATLDFDKWRVAFLYDIPLLFALYRSRERSDSTKEDLALWLLEIGDSEERNLYDDLKHLVVRFDSENANVLLRAALQFCFTSPASLYDGDRVSNPVNAEQEDGSRANSVADQAVKRGKIVEALIRFVGWNLVQKNCVQELAPTPVFAGGSFFREIPLFSVLPLQPYVDQGNYQTITKDMRAWAHFLDHVCALCREILTQVSAVRGASNIIDELGDWFVRIVRSTFCLPLSSSQVDQLCTCASMLPARGMAVPFVESCYALTDETAQAGALHFLVRGVALQYPSSSLASETKIVSEIRLQCVQALVWYFRRSLSGQEQVCRAIDRYFVAPSDSSPPANVLAPRSCIIGPLKDQIYIHLDRCFSPIDTCAKEALLPKGWLARAFCPNSGQCVANIGLLLGAVARIESFSGWQEKRTDRAAQDQSCNFSSLGASNLVKMLDASFFNQVSIAKHAEQHMGFALFRERKSGRNKACMRSLSPATLAYFPLIESQIVLNNIADDDDSGADAEADADEDSIFRALSRAGRIGSASLASPRPIKTVDSQFVQNVLDIGAACALWYIDQGHIDKATAQYAQLGAIALSNVQSIRDVHVQGRHITYRPYLLCGGHHQILRHVSFLCNNMHRCDWTAKIYALAALCRLDCIDSPALGTSIFEQPHIPWVMRTAALLQVLNVLDEKLTPSYHAFAAIELLLLRALERSLNPKFWDCISEKMLADAIAQSESDPGLGQSAIGEKSAQLYLRFGRKLCTHGSMFTDDSMSVSSLLVKHYFSVIMPLLRLKTEYKNESALNHEEQRSLPWEHAVRSVANEALTVLSKASTPIPQWLFDGLTTVILAPRFFANLASLSVQLGSTLLALPQHAHHARSAKLVLEAYVMVLEPHRHIPLSFAAVANVSADLELLVNDGFFSQDAAKWQRDLFPRLIGPLSDRLCSFGTLKGTLHDAAHRLTTAVANMRLLENDVPARRKVTAQRQVYQALSSFRRLGLLSQHGSRPQTSENSIPLSNLVDELPNTKERNKSKSVQNHDSKRRRKRYRRPQQPSLRPSSAPATGTGGLLMPRKTRNKFIEQGLLETTEAGDSDGYEDLEDFIV